MQKILLYKYGSKNSYKYIDIAEKEKLSVGQVRVDIKYIGISFTDLIIKKGLYKYQKDNYPLPFCQGFEFSGVISEVTSDEYEYEVGEEVCGLVKFGCFANKIIINKNNIFKIPKTYSLKEAITFPVNFFTAYHALCNIVKIKKDSVVMIYSGAGGVGGMILQLSKILGYKTIAIVSNKEKEMYVKNLGADFVFCGDVLNNLKKNNIKVDIVFDSNGTFNINEFNDVLSLNSKIIVLGFNSLLTKNIFRNILNYFSLLKPKIFDLVYNNITVSGFNIIKFTEDGDYFKETKSELQKYLNDEKLIIPKIREYQFSEMEEPIESLSDRNNFGKVIIKI